MTASPAMTAAMAPMFASAVPAILAMLASKGIEAGAISDSHEYPRIIGLVPLDTLKSKGGFNNPLKSRVCEYADGTRPRKEPVDNFASLILTFMPSESRGKTTGHNLWVSLSVPTNSRAKSFRGARCIEENFQFPVDGMLAEDDVTPALRAILSRFNLA
jgi:hypothetical protein